MWSEKVRTGRTGQLHKSLTGFALPPAAPGDVHKGGAEV